MSTQHAESRGSSAGPNVTVAIGGQALRLAISMAAQNATAQQVNAQSLGQAALAQALAGLEGLTSRHDPQPQVTHES